MTDWPTANQVSGWCKTINLVCLASFYGSARPELFHSQSEWKSQIKAKCNLCYLLKYHLILPHEALNGTLWNGICSNPALYQEFVTVRVCNSHTVSTPTMWTVWCKQSARNMLSRNLTWSYQNPPLVFSQLSIFTADCLCHTAQIANMV